MSNDGTKAVILSSPSGGGKSTIIRHLLQQFPNYWHSISCTTRSPRYGEINGREYHFIDREAFQKLIENNALAEWAEVHGDWYGTPLEPLHQRQQQHLNILFDLDVVGTAKLKEQWNGIFSIYLLAPSREELERRLRRRKSESEERIQHRLKRFEMEQNAAEKYDCRIVNDKIPDTLEKVIEAIDNWQKLVKF